MTEPLGILERLDNLSDRLSPIVVKEVRQIVRGREFNYSFSLTLVAGLLVAFLGAADAIIAENAAGGRIFGSLMTCLTIVGMAIVPLGTFNALRSERAERTLDLITLTALSPRRIVIGKLLAQGVKLVTLFACLAPFVAMSFLLGGIDLVTILASLAALFMWSLWACALCLFLSSLAKSKAMGGVIFVAIGLLFLLILTVGRPLFMALTYGPGFYGGPVFFGGSGPTGSEVWWALGITSTFCLSTMVNLVLLAENRLSLPAEDRVTALRVGFFVQFLLICGWSLAFTRAPGIASSDAVTMLAVLGGVHLAAVAIFTVTEDLALSRRVLLQNQFAPRWRGPVSIFRPGGGRGAAYVLVQMSLLLIVGKLLKAKPEDLRLLLAMCGYICFFTGVVACCGRRIAPLRVQAKHLRVGVMLLVAAVMLLTDLVAYALTPENEFHVEYSARHVLNPFRTLANWRIAEINQWHSAALAMGVIGLIFYLVLIQMGRNETALQPAVGGSPRDPVAEPSAEQS